MTYKKPEDGDYLCSIEYLKKQIAQQLRDKFAYQKKEKAAKKKLKLNVAYDHEISILITKQIEQLPVDSFRPSTNELKPIPPLPKHTDRLSVKKRMRHRRK